MMKKEEMINLVERQLTAYNSRDLVAFCDCYHPQVTVTNLLEGKIRCNSIAEFREIYRPLFSSSPNLHCEVKKRTVVEGSIVDEEYVTGASRFPDGLHTVAIYGFRDGLIDRVWFTR